MPTTTTSEANNGSTTSTTEFQPPSVTHPDVWYVDALYQLFLGRSPSLSEMAAGIDQVRTAGRPALTSSLSTSTEWAGVVVDGIYLDALDRQPDAGGRAYWVQQLDSGASTKAVAVSIYGSVEAVDRAGANRAYVESLYLRILGRLPDAAGHDFWTGQLDAGISPTVIVSGFWDSIEFRRQRVAGVYEDVLGRAPDAGGHTYWAGQLLVMDEVRLAAQLAASDEFYARAQND